MDRTTLDRLESDLASLETELEDSGQTTHALTVGRAIAAFSGLRDELDKLDGEVSRLEAGGEPGRELALAKVIRVAREGGRPSLEIDGAEFPWYIHEEGVSIGHIRRDDVPRVVVPIIAERVEVIDSIDTAPTESLFEDTNRVLRTTGAEELEQPEPEHERTTTPAPERAELEQEPGIVRPGRDR